MKKNNLCSLILGITVGSISGYVLRNLHYHYQTKHTDQILEQVKTEFAKKAM